MAITPIKAEVVVRTALGLLERDIVLPGMVWRVAGDQFRGAKNDTVTLRLPSFATGDRRTLRGARPQDGSDLYTAKDLEETSVDVKLDTDVYRAIKLDDEQLTLDIESFGEQVLAPIVKAVANEAEDVLGDLMSNTSYNTELILDQSDPFKTVVAARKALNKANVPAAGRRLVVGADVEEIMLNSDKLVKANEAGSDSALRDARIGRLAGVDVFTTNAVAPDEAFLFHETAYAMTIQAPVVPAGAGWGASDSYAGLAMRVIRDYDYANARDRMLANTYVGVAAVKDQLVEDSTGRLRPAAVGEGEDPEPAMFRAVKIVLDADES